CHLICLDVHSNHIQYWEFKCELLLNEVISPINGDKERKDI
ncbi:unnamed protein product, partial [Allacma fusca]